MAGHQQETGKNMLSEEISYQGVLMTVDFEEDKIDGEIEVYNVIVGDECITDILSGKTLKAIAEDIRDLRAALASDGDDNNAIDRWDIRND
jgi:hypothetical protein